MSILGDACTGLKAYLETQFPDFPWDIGAVDGPTKTHHGYVFAQGTSKGQPISLDQVQLYVRIFVPRQAENPKVRNPDTPLDPTELYDLVDQLKVALGAEQTEAFGLWYYNLESVDVDHIVHGIEATLIAMVESPFDAFS